MSYDESVGTQAELAKNDPIDVPLTLDEWAAKRGYDPVTRTYRDDPVPDVSSAQHHQIRSDTPISPKHSTY